MTEEINFDSGKMFSRPPIKTGALSVFTQYPGRVIPLRNRIADTLQQLSISNCYCNTGFASLSVTIGQPPSSFIGDITNIAGGIADAIGPAHRNLIDNMDQYTENQYDSRIHPSIPLLISDDSMFSVLHVERVISELEWYRLQVSGHYDENSRGYNDSL